MLPFSYLVSLSILWTFATCNPRPITDFSQVAWDTLASNQAFTLEQVEVPRTRSWSPYHEVLRTHLKYGIKPPEHIEQAVRDYDVQAAEPVTGTVAAKGFRNEAEYLINVKVGNHNLSLDLDTGSADLWVFSTLQPTNQRQGRNIGRIYDPQGSGGKVLDSHSWQIRYGDGSTASGQVYLDQVSVGGLTFPKQAIEAAAKVSASFSRDANIDGLLGLASSRINTIKPNRQNTWFDNIKPKLASPVFTSTLKRRAVGAYDFGFIDKAKYKGEINWVNCPQAKGFWDFDITGFQVGGSAGPVQNARWASIADTGSSLWYVPAQVASAYYSQVPKATRGGQGVPPGQYTFPCNEKLPDLSVIIGGKKLVVPGINMNYQTIGGGACFGGIQPASASIPNIAGDVFLKNIFVAFEHPVKGNARLGFAQT